MDEFFCHEHPELEDEKTNNKQKKYFSENHRWTGTKHGKHFRRGKSEF